MRANSGVTVSSYLPNIEQSGRSIDKGLGAENIYGNDFKNKSDINLSSMLSVINNSKSISYIEKEENEFNKISNVIRKKSVNNQSDFQQRFQDKQTFMNKEGHLGIVKNA
jgi:hypothetical protein